MSKDHIKKKNRTDVKDKTNARKIVLKCDMHLHTREDPLDYRQIEYSAFELIDNLDAKGFDVFSITLHNGMFKKDMMNKVLKYAKSRGMLFIPGIEKTIENKHVLIYNMKKEHAENIDNYNQLKKIVLKKYTKKGKRMESLLIVAPHPYFPIPTASGKNLGRWKETFDALEYNSFYLKFFNPNIKSCKKAKIMKKPMVGNTDAHALEQIGNTYTEIYIDSHDVLLNRRAAKSLDRTADSHELLKKFIKKCSDKEYDKLRLEVINKIKSGNTKIVTRPLNLFYVIKFIAIVIKCSLLELLDNGIKNSARKTIKKYNIKTK